LALNLRERIGIARGCAQAAEDNDPRLRGRLSAAAAPALAEPARHGPGQPSGLNHDASPLQLCLSLRQQGSGWRAIYDPGIGEATPERRFQAALDCLTDHDAGFRGDAHTLLSRIGPGMLLSAASFDYGVFWLAAEVAGKGRALYADITAHEGRDDLGTLATECLSDLAGTPGEIPETVAALTRMSVPASVGFERRGDARRLKLHVRLSGRPPAGALARALPCLADATLLKAAAAAAILGLHWPEALFERLRSFSRIAFVGVGRDLQGEPRLKLYLKPNTPIDA
jgi:hypothetical protein